MAMDYADSNPLPFVVSGEYYDEDCPALSLYESLKETPREPRFKPNKFGAVDVDRCRQLAATKSAPIHERNRRLKLHTFEYVVSNGEKPCLYSWKDYYYSLCSAGFPEYAKDHYCEKIKAAIERGRLKGHGC